jgi:hypothetical protein
LTDWGIVMKSIRRCLPATLLACSGLALAGCDGGGRGSLSLREIDSANKRIATLERRVTELEARAAGGVNPAAARDNP